MDTFYSITPSPKFKRLSFEHYEYIIREVTKHDAAHPSKRRNTGRTALIRNLAHHVGASVSTVYDILKDASITVLDTYLRPSSELSASAAFHKRNKANKPSNASKLAKASAFIDIVSDEILLNPLSSIDETIHDLVLNRPHLIDGLTTVSTKTFYNYVHAGLIKIKPIDLPRTVQRKKTPNDKAYIPKCQKGTSIDERPSYINDRLVFGHWEGDLVTGPRDGRNGALLTLIERKTRFYYMIPIKNKSAKQVYMKINQLNKLFGDAFPDIFKSITFDNGSEFARYKDIERKPGSKLKRTTVYFAHPYRSYERGSNENCNGLVRYFIKKGTDINLLDRDFLKDINFKINDKKRKILGYLPSSLLFKRELSSFLPNPDINFYL